MLEMLGDALVVDRGMVRRRPLVPSTLNWLTQVPLTYRPELLHPFASAIDEPELKVPAEMVRFAISQVSLKLMRGPSCQTVLMTASAPAYVRLPEGPKKGFKEYPEASLDDWHKEHGEYVE